MTKGIVCGTFDLLHAGHVLMLKACKEQCDWLVVGLHIDPSIERPGKNKPVESVEERVVRLEGCRYVDQIILYETQDDCRTLKQKLMPDMVFRGADHEGLPCPGDDLGIKTIYIQRDHDYGSGRLRRRILDAGTGLT
jgi:glycerol-3-phosphate cytidylyltransferase